MQKKHFENRSKLFWGGAGRIIRGAPDSAAAATAAKLHTDRGGKKSTAVFFASLQQVNHKCGQRSYYGELHSRFPPAS